MTTAPMRFQNIEEEDEEKPTYTQPIKLENLPYTPTELGGMLEEHATTKRSVIKQVNIDGLGGGRLAITKSNNPSEGYQTLFYADEKNQAFNQQQVNKAETLFTFANAPAILAPFLAPITAKSKPVTRIKADGGKHNITKGGQTIFQQRKSNKNTLKRLKTEERVEDVTGFGDKSIVVDEVLNMPNVRIRDIVRIAKKNKISYEKAEAYVNLKEQGIVPKDTINPGTNKGLLKKGEGPYDPGKDEVYIPPEERIGTQKGDPLKIDLGFGDGFSVGKPKKGEPYSVFFSRIMNQNGARSDETGGLVMTAEAFKNIKSSNVRREIAQLILTDINQGVKGSFFTEKFKKNTKLNKDLAAYNKKYAARADLHHGYPSVIGIDFYLDIPHMGPQWKQRQAIAAEYGNVPGQPMVEGKSNLVALPSGSPSTKKGVPIPEYGEAKAALAEKGRRIPKHLHQIIHNQFLANEMGQKGEKFWERWNPIIDAKGEEGWLEAYRAYNDIIARNRALYDEALAQLDIFFSKASLTENPEKLVELLEEYVGTGKITIGSGGVLNKAGETVMEAGTLRPATVQYQQGAVQYIVEDALSDFKVAANKLLNQDPRMADVVETVKGIPGLTGAEIQRAEELLFQIKYYNSILLTAGKSRAYQVTRISALQHKKNVTEYYDLIQLKLPIQLNKATLNETVFEGTKLPSLEKQMELILDPPTQLEMNLKKENPLL